MALVLTRKSGQSIDIYIGDQKIKITYLLTRNLQGKFLIDAPREFEILREEIVDKYRNNK